MNDNSKAQGEGKRVRFRMAGYVFTYRRDSGEAQTRIEMWREDPETGERYWISVAACAPNPRSARSVALALVAWVKSCDVGTKRDAQSQAVAESFALLRERLAVQEPEARGSVRARPAGKGHLRLVTPSGEAGEIPGAAA